MVSALTAALVLGQAPIAGWTMYVSSKDHFTVELPGKPTVTSMKNEAQGIVATTNDYTVKSPEVNAVVTATTLNDKSPKTALNVANGIKMGLMKKIGGKPGPDVVRTYSGRKGRETRFQDANGRFGSIWITGTPGHVYSLTILGIHKAPKAEALRFFSSFHLA